MAWLPTAAGIIVLAFSGLLGGTILFWIWNGKISLQKLLCEPNGDASLSRLQFLIFTFVISLSLFLIIVAHKDGPAFPDNMPPEILTLLGISASSYLVSKGIQFANPGAVTKPTLLISPATVTDLKVSTDASFKVTMLNVASGTTMPTLNWAIEAPVQGMLKPTPPDTAKYTAPATSPGPGNNVVRIRVWADGFEDGTATVTLA